VWNVRVPDRYVAQKEVWYDRKTKLPIKVLLFDPNGRVVLRADLSKHKPVQAQQVQGQPGLYAPMAVSTPTQTLAITSLCLGIASITVGWCCSTGLLMSPAALITGFIALSQIKKDPRSFSGRGLAIGGIVTGTIYLSVLVLIILIYGIAIIGGGLSSLR